MVLVIILKVWRAYLGEFTSWPVVDSPLVASAAPPSCLCASKEGIVM